MPAIAKPRLFPAPTRSPLPPGLGASPFERKRLDGRVGLFESATAVARHADWSTDRTRTAVAWVDPEATRGAAVWRLACWGVARPVA
jgi:hypothetical protein